MIKAEIETKDWSIRIKLYAVRIALFLTANYALSTAKAKFHYASWFGAGSKPNSIMLSGSNQLRTSSEPASEMEFDFNCSPMTPAN